MEKLSKLFQKWITDYLRKHDNNLPNEWNTEFNNNNFEQFVILESIRVNNINSIKCSTGK